MLSYLRFTFFFLYQMIFLMMLITQCIWMCNHNNNKYNKHQDAFTWMLSVCVCVSHHYNYIRRIILYINDIKYVTIFSYSFCFVRVFCLFRPSTVCTWRINMIFSCLLLCVFFLYSILLSRLMLRNAIHFWLFAVLYPKFIYCMLLTWVGRQKLFTSYNFSDYISSSYKVV